MNRISYALLLFSNPLTALPFSSRKTINTEVRTLFNTLFLSEMRKLKATWVFVETNIKVL